MRIKFGPFGLVRGDTDQENDDNRWRTFFCCHVRTATIFLGIIHLAFHILSLTSIVIAILHPNHVQQTIPSSDPDLSLLPTPQSEVQEEPHALPVSESLTAPAYNQPDSEMVEAFLCAPFTNNCMRNHEVKAQDLNMHMLVTFCTMAITLFMIYGAIRGKASCLMPFFCLQVFNFCVTSLSVVGFLSYVPDIRTILIRNQNIPMREQLLAMDPQCLSLLLLAFMLATLLSKAYFINMVWKCYKFLAIRAAAAAVIRDVHITSECEGQALFDVSVLSRVSGSADLPDYATAISDPRFAEKPAYSVSPPPYSAVVDLPPEESPGAATNEAADAKPEAAQAANVNPENKV